MISDRTRKRHLGLAFAFALAVVAAPLAQIGQKHAAGFAG